MLKYLFILFLFGCSPLRPWKQVAADPNVTPVKKQIISAKVAALFPTQTKYLPGTVTVKTDTIYDDQVNVDYILYVNDLLDSMLIQNDRTAGENDSLRKAILKRLQPVTIRTIQIRVDTVYPENPGTAAKISGLLQDLEVCETTNAAIQANNEAYLVRNAELQRGQRKWLWWLIGACVALAGSMYLNFKR